MENNFPAPATSGVGRKLLQLNKKLNQFTQKHNSIELAPADDDDEGSLVAPTSQPTLLSFSPFAQSGATGVRVEVVLGKFNLKFLWSFEVWEERGSGSSIEPTNGTPGQVSVGNRRCRSMQFELLGTVELHFPVELVQSLEASCDE